MPDKQVYIHYGDYYFRTPQPIKNLEYFTKPRGGLWASRKNGELTWRDWCEAEEFRLDSLNESFEFTLKDDARILTLNDEEQLTDLPVLFRERYASDYSSIYLDFEKLKEQYDAIEVTNISNLYWKLYGWDCNSILIMNPDIVEVMEHEEGDI